MAVQPSDAIGFVPALPRPPQPPAARSETWAATNEVSSPFNLLQLRFARTVLLTTHLHGIPSDLVTTLRWPTVGDRMSSRMLS